MNYRPLLRALLASAVMAAAAVVAGCDTDGAGLPSGRALAPLSDKMLAEIEAKNMSKESPILVRLFKEESELEVWKQDNSGRFELLKTYPICRWSGELGPKVKLGDRQAPEGFYTISPGQMNPNSNYYLAINTGFPNAYDRANGRTGEFLMIHGDCSSAGCYAMTDEQIAEIYALARESFFGGQKSFQIQAYPFRMTPLNMAKHRDSPNMAFWKMIKEGYDHFEVTHQEPKVDVCDKHYVFNAAAPNGPASALHFSPAAKCPAYELPQEIAGPVKERQQREEAQVAQLISRGTPTVPVRTGTDGGMNPVFLAAVQFHGGTQFPIQSSSSLPGTIPANIRPPGAPAAPETTGSTMSLASSESRPVPAPRASAAAQPSSGNLFSGLFSSNGEGAKGNDSQSGGGMLDKMSRLVGLGGSDQGGDAAAKSKPAAKPTQTASAATARPKPAAGAAAAQPEVKSANAAAPAPAKPPASSAPQTPTDTQQEAVNTANLLRGAQATVPAGSFD
ncbi:MAG TPA: murein L,D-transpeptidase family protein, partial [Xanthobacteraceae bacterium]